MPRSDAPLLLLGGSGLLGNALRAAATRRSAGLISPTRAALDIRNAAGIARALADHRPLLVINAVGFTQVDAAENETAACDELNDRAVHALATVCAATQTPLIHLSTDFVFDGTQRRPYRAGDAPAPLSAYGRSKLAGEQAVRAAQPEHVILRTAWLFGTTGRSFVRSIVRQVLRGAPLRVVADQIGSPTPAPALAEGILDIADRIRAARPRWGIFHAAGGPACSWHDLAGAITGLMQAPTPLAIAAADYPAAARRPPYSALDCSCLRDAYGVPAIDWRQGLPSIVSALAATESALMQSPAEAVCVPAGSGAG